MTTQMIIRIKPELKDKLNRLARTEGRPTSSVLRDMIERYIEEHDIGPSIDDLWDRIGKKLGPKGMSPSRIDHAIKTVRKKHG